MALTTDLTRVEVAQAYKASCLRRLYYEIARDPDSFKASVQKSFGRVGMEFDETLEPTNQTSTNSSNSGTTTVPDKVSPNLTPRWPILSVL